MEHRTLEISRAPNVQTKVWQSEKLSWPDFAKELKAMTKVIPYDYQRYFSLPDNEQKALKNGPAFLFGALDKTGLRQKNHIKSREGFVWDLDRCDWESFNQSIRLIDESGYNYCIHSTASYDYTQPKFRIIIPSARSLAPAEYKQEALKAKKLFDIPDDDPCSYEDTHAMYFPAHLQNIEPIFQCRIDGEYLNPDTIPDVVAPKTRTTETALDNQSNVLKPSTMRIAIEAVSKWSKREQNNLQEYPNYLSALMVIVRTVQQGGIDLETGRECAKALAGDNAKWQTANVQHFEQELKNPNIRTEYTFNQKFGVKLPKPRRYDIADQLVQVELREIIFYVDQMLPVGVGWLAGEPKVGKSFIALQIANDVATGSTFLESSDFDGFTTRQSPVIYYSLEMAPNLMQDRLLSMYPVGGVSNQLYIYYDLPRFDKGGYRALESDIKMHRAKIVFIDVHGLVSAKKSSQNPLYEQTYEEIAPLREIAEANECCIVLITHLNKNSDNSPFNRMMGSTANRGSSDFNIVMSKTRDGQTELLEESRKSEGLELILKWSSRPAGFEFVSTVDNMLKAKRQEEYLTHPLANAIKVALMHRYRIEVSATDLRDLMPDWLRSEWTPQKIGVQIRKLEHSLNFYDEIIFTNTRIGNRRYYTFTRPRNKELSTIMDDFLPNSDQLVMSPLPEQVSICSTYK